MRGHSEKFPDLFCPTAVSSFAMNDLPTTYDLVLGQNGQTGWLLDMDILAPGGLLGFGDNDDYYEWVGRSRLNSNYRATRSVPLRR